MVFTAGAPGSGKTYCLHRIYGLDNITVLDLDSEIQHHPAYNPDVPEEVYADRIAYEWANRKVEQRFSRTICEHAGKRSLVCLDGTGTHVERQVRRMREAKDQGWWIVQLYVRVRLETALTRNASRQRRVPEDVLRAYCSQLERSISEVRAVPDLVDELVLFDNDQDDGRRGADRWGAAADRVWRQSKSRGKAIRWPQLTL
jgi:predicted ABC-type ATPase